jgi:hypothetical protein
MLGNAYKLDPVNIFLYTWQFLATLEREEENTKMKKLYRWFRIVSILIVPAAIVGLFTGMVFAYGKYN